MSIPYAAGSSTGATFPQSRAAWTSTSISVPRRTSCPSGDLICGSANPLKSRLPGFASQALKLEPLPQAYHRTAEQTYRYESAGGKFVRDLTVNDAGFVIHYPDFFCLEEAS